MKFLKTLSALAVFCLVGFAAPAMAASISFGPTSASGSGPTINFNGLVTPTGLTGDATITFTVNADLNSSHEYVDIDLDGFSLGRVFNNDSSDDPFDFASDVGNQSTSNLTGSATIANANFAPLIADGVLNLSFDFSGSVNCCGTVNHLSGTITFSEVSAVPLPAGLPLMGAGLVAFGLMRRRNKA